MRRLRPRTQSALLNVLEHILQELRKNTITLRSIVSNQEHLDSSVAAMTTQLDEVIAALKAQPAAEQIDWAGLDTFAQTLADVVPTAVDPEPPTTADEGVPAADGSETP